MVKLTPERIKALQAEMKSIPKSLQVTWLKSVTRRITRKPERSKTEMANEALNYYIRMNGIRRSPTPSESEVTCLTGTTASSVTDSETTTEGSEDIEFSEVSAEDDAHSVTSATSSVICIGTSDGTHVHQPCITDDEVIQAPAPPVVKPRRRLTWHLQQHE